MADVNGTPNLALVGGRAGLAADVVAKALVGAGIEVGSLAEPPELAIDAVVLVEPRPADWRSASMIDAPVIVFTAEPADAQSLAAALRRGARAIIDGESDVDAVVRAVDLIDLGVMLTVEQVVVLVDAIELDVPANEEAPRLSRREAQILASIARGESMKQAARALGISEKTVENLQSRLHLKLGARSRAQAVARAHVLGLLPDEGLPEA